MKFSPASEGACQELGLKRPGVGDEDLHEFRFSGAGSRSNVHNTIYFHCTMMPERARNECRLHHIGLVMNPRSLSTFVELRSYTGFAAALSGAASVYAGELNTDAALGGFITFSMAILCPCTAVDSTFQVLLFLDDNDTFFETAQSPELKIRRSEQR